MAGVDNVMIPLQLFFLRVQVIWVRTIGSMFAVSCRMNVDWEAKVLAHCVKIRVGTNTVTVMCLSASIQL